MSQIREVMLAISKTEVKRYTLKAKSELEREAADYRTEVMKRKVDDGLAEAAIR